MMLQMIMKIIQMMKVKMMKVRIKVKQLQRKSTINRHCIVEQYLTVFSCFVWMLAFPVCSFLFPFPIVSDGNEDEDAQRQAAQQYYAQQAAAQQQYANNYPLSPSSAANYAANASYAQNPSQSPHTTASYASIAAAQAAYRQYQEQAQQEQQQQYYQQQAPLSPTSAASSSYSSRPQYAVIPSASSGRRSRHFHLTRILLKMVASMASTGEIGAEEKTLLKELIVDQVQEVYEVAEEFDQTNDLYNFKRQLVQMAQRR